MKKILLVEDDLDQIKMYQQKFEMEGYQVESARSGAEGLEKIKSFNPDLLLLDIIMQGMDGLEVLKKIRKEHNKEQLPVIVFTNSAKEGLADKSYDLGATDYIFKTGIEPKDVLERIKAII